MSGAGKLCVLVLALPSPLLDVRICSVLRSTDNGEERARDGAWTVETHTRKKAHADVTWSRIGCIGCDRGPFSKQEGERPVARGQQGLVARGVRTTRVLIACLRREPGERKLPRASRPSSVRRTAIGVILPTVCVCTIKGLSRTSKIQLSILCTRV